MKKSREIRTHINFIYALRAFDDNNRIDDNKNGNINAETKPIVIMIVIQARAEIYIAHHFSPYVHVEENKENS